MHKLHFKVAITQLARYLNPSCFRDMLSLAIRDRQYIYVVWTLPYKSWNFTYSSTTFKVSIAKYFRINVFFYSLINMKHLFHGSCENSFSFGKLMLQIAYIVVYILLLEEYVVFTKFLYSQLTSQRPQLISQSISCIFYNLKGLGRRTLTKQFFECCL